MLKKAMEDWMPPVLLRVLKRVVEEARFLKYENKESIAKNKELKGAGTGKRAFLLATGPSIKYENLKVLADEDCFSVSNFFLHEDINIIKPKFHFFAPYHEPLILSNYIEWLRLSDEKLPKETKIILGHTTYRMIKECNIFPRRELYYLYLSGSPNRKRVDITKPVLAPQTSPLMVLPVLIYMGYERIHLLGCDHTVLRDYGKHVSNFYPHHMDKRENATDPGIWKDIIYEHQGSLNIFLQYRWYENIAKQNDIIMINLSRDSWLDLFPSKKLEDIICA